MPPTWYVPHQGPQLDLLHEGCLLGGFLSYKIALLVKLVDELTPKVRQGVRRRRVYKSTTQACA